MIDRNEIRRVVIRELEDFAPDYVGRIEEHHRLLTDLKLTGDDASIFALQSARRLRITVPIREWRTVTTVGDAIALLAAHAPT